MIPHDSFAESDIEEVEIPASVTEIQHDAFWSCRNLKQVRFQEGSCLRLIGDRAFGMTGISEFICPKFVARIGQQAFELCGRLRSIVLGEKLEKIEPYCFHRSGLQKIDIPASVRVIEKYAFWDCRSLSEVAFPEDS